MYNSWDVEWTGSICWDLSWHPHKTPAIMCGPAQPQLAGLHFLKKNSAGLHRRRDWDRARSSRRPDRRWPRGVRVARICRLRTCRWANRMEAIVYLYYQFFALCFTCSPFTSSHTPERTSHPFCPLEKGTLAKRKKNSFLAAIATTL